MSSDDFKPRQEPRMQFAGTGMASTFLCAKCGRFRLLLGRRKLPVRGVKQWVCADCNPKESA